MPASALNTTYLSNMQGTELPSSALHFIDTAIASFHKIPGSAIVIRYIKSSYQNDPIRSLVELFLFIFAVRYLLAPTYSTKKGKNVPLSEEEIEELVED